MCKIHHAAFDGSILGIRPDLRVQVRRDVFKELDGPMLRHGLQEMHDRPVLLVPRYNTHSLTCHALERFAEFEATG